MSHILLTGMTASHTSALSNERHLSFAGLIYKALTERGHVVDWKDPSVLMTLKDMERYESIVIGMAPITSLAANRTYGALNLIDCLLEIDDPRTALFIDAPSPGQITQSLKSIASTPNNLTKPFFSYRKEYHLANEPKTKKRLLNIVNALLEGPWPNTFYPRLPWESGSVGSLLPPGASRLLEGVYLDSVAYRPQRAPEADRDLFWLVDHPRTAWSAAVTHGLILPTEKMQDNKYTSDVEVGKKMSRAVGSLISPARAGETWWTYRYIQALNHVSPVATNWRESMSIGDAWNVLPSSIEALNQKERNELSEKQTEQYLNAIYSKEDAKDVLETVVKLSL